MLQGKRTRRIIAATLLTVMLTNTLAPTVTYALTSGPTAPEATSFEPVDTTDMVNLQTGDFTYNLPLMQVPGPEGGYPLSLSYHAGIQPDQDASWVGLGWTLNPGAITRNVNSYPDDWHDVKQVIRDYWSGGETKTFGVNIGLPMGPANVSFGLSFAHDTYRGYGMGADVGFGVGIANGVGIEIGMSGGAYGGMSANLGLQLGEKGSPVSGSLGISTDGNSVDGYGGMGVGGVGFSISTSGSVSVKAFGAGVSAAYNNNAGKIQSSSHGFSLPLGAISLSWNYSRYWSDETANVTTHGVLYMRLPDLEWQGGYYDHGMMHNAFDVYHLHDDPEKSNIAEEPDVRKVPGGTFPDNDVYQVTSQGLGGSFRPYVYQEELYSQTVGGDDVKVRAQNNDYFDPMDAGRVITANYPAETSNTPQSLIHFRFTGDFSNTFTQSAPTFSQEANGLVHYNFDGSYKTGVYYNPSLNKLAGSKNIEYYTNRQINSLTARSKGFIDVNASSARGFSRQTDDLIGGFSITNESGVTYHYALPAYESNEVMYSENMPSERNSKGYIWNKVSKPGKYAYTWFLTAITGPDFVDVNSNGFADDSDWGYWVNFEYGKWADAYSWRNPSEGYHRDLDTRFENYSKGLKEIYYLNFIKTRSHAAIFEKDIRYDGKGTSYNSTGINNHDGSVSYVFDGTSKSVMRLDKIYLLNRQNFDNLVDPASGVQDSYNNSLHLPANVVDKADIDPIRTAVTNASIKVVDFNYDYSLCDRTSNSFSYGNPAAKMGKLTLTSVLTRGKSGAVTMPPVRFNYDLPASEKRSGSATFTNDNFLINSISMATYQSDLFNVGDILRMEREGSFAYGVVTEKLSGLNYTVQFIGSSSRYFRNLSTTVTTTKNPCYATDAHDEWGMFKSDFAPILSILNENMARTTTPASSKGVDAWSLRSIQTPIGATIAVSYQSDSYTKTVLSDHISLILQQQGSANLLNSDVSEITFMAQNNQNIPLSNYLSVGQDVTSDIVAKEYCKTNSGLSYWSDLQNPLWADKINPGHTYFRYVVSALNGNNITLRCEWRPNDVNLDMRSSATDYKIIANLRIKNVTNWEFLGGGLRVGSIEVKTVASEQIKRTVYQYAPLNGGYSSGVIAFHPKVFDEYDTNTFSSLYGTEHVWTGGFGGVADDEDRQKAEKLYKKYLYKDISYLLAISRELPPPAVLYEYVTVHDEVQNPGETSARLVEGNTVYQYEVFNANMLRIAENTDRQYFRASGAMEVYKHERNMSLKDYTARLGLLKGVTRYDVNGKALSQTRHNYLHDDIANNDPKTFSDTYDARLSDANTYNNQGVVKERFAAARVAWPAPDYKMTNLYVMSMKEEYPAIPTGETVYNEVDGTMAQSQIIGFDYYSGATTKTISIDEYGNRFLTEVVPAYNKYPALGPRVNNGANKNMLTQNAGTYTYKVDDANQKMGLVSASVNTWSNTTPVVDISGNALVQDGSNSSYGNVWRMKSTYSWLPNNKTADGITSIGAFSDYNWASPTSTSADWKLTSDISLYDVYSHSLEAKDLNGNYTATRLDYGNKKVIVSGSMAGYYEIAYSGAEDNNPAVQKADGAITTAAAHTGTQSLKLKAADKKAFVYTVNTNKLVPGRPYIANVWVKPASGATSDVRLYYQINGVEKATSVSAVNSTKTAGGWTLLNLMINGSDIVSGATLTVGCRNDVSPTDTYLDDFRFQPLNGVSTAYVYDAFSGELTYVLDNNNLYTKYEYDAAGRLVRVYREKLGAGQLKTQEYQYNFGAGKWLSDEINQSMAKNDCPNNGAGSLVPVFVPRGKYFSYVSPQEANAQATADAQAQANSAGSCSTVYARLTWENTQWAGYGTVGDLVVYFYADEACTRAVDPINIYVQVNSTNTCSGNCWPGNGYGDWGKTVSGRRAVLLSGQLVSWQNTDDPDNPCDCWMDVNLLPSSNYNIAY